MKKLALTTLAVAGFAIGAFAQGAVNMDNSASAGGIVLSDGTTYYEGHFGAQLFMLNSLTLPSAVDTGVNSATPEDAYSYLTGGNGFFLEGTWTGQSMAGVTAGVISLGEVDMSQVTPAAANAVLALVIWGGDYANWTAARNAQALGGVFAFVNKTSDYTAPTPVPAPPLDGFANNVVLHTLTPVPEPATFALAGLGAAAMLIFRRRK